MAELSEYEQLREANIKRNREVMIALGLEDFDFRAHAQHKRKSSGATTKKRKRKYERAPLHSDCHCPLRPPSRLAVPRRDAYWPCPTVCQASRSSGAEA